MKHDDHYRNIEARGLSEPMALMEDLNSRETIPAKARTALVMAAKHLQRAGEKGDWMQDVDKALNYLYRARYGCWMPKESE